MKLIQPSYEILEQQDIYEHIEICGRTCYKSTDKITPDSAKPFVERMMKSKHYAMLEHGTVYLRLLMWKDYDIFAKRFYESNPYSKVKCNAGNAFITTNMRVLIENGRMGDLKYMVNPTDPHYKRHTVRFVCNRQVSHEFVRHRAFSFAQESTRYCNYNKDKFGAELTFIDPVWCNSEDTDKDALISALSKIEKTYMRLIDAEKWKPQEAATILPNALKTELIMTGYEEDWKHFFSLRALGTTGKPHPQASQLAIPLMEEFKGKGWYKD